MKLPTDADIRSIAKLCGEGIPLAIAAEACGVQRRVATLWLERARNAGRSDTPEYRFEQAVLRARAAHQIEHFRKSKKQEDSDAWLQFIDPEVWKGSPGDEQPTQVSGAHHSLAMAALGAPTAVMGAREVLGRLELALPALRAQANHEDAEQNRKHSTAQACEEGRDIIDVEGEGEDA